MNVVGVSEVGESRVEQLILGVAEEALEGAVAAKQSAIGADQGDGQPRAIEDQAEERFGIAHVLHASSPRWGQWTMGAAATPDGSEYTSGAPRLLPLPEHDAGV